MPVLVRVKLLFVLVSKTLLIPEVENLCDDVTFGIAMQVDVRGLEIAMDDPLRMRQVEGLRDRHEHFAAELGLERSSLLETRVEPLSVEQLEHQERRAVFGLPEIEDLDDARAPDAPASLSLR